MKVTRPGEDPAEGPAEREPRSHGPDEPDQERSRRTAPPPPKKKPKWKKALAVAMTPLAAIGAAGAMPHPGTDGPSPFRTYTLVPGGTFKPADLAASAIGHPSSGGEYKLRTDWQALGLTEAVRLATAVLNLANSRAGGRSLEPDVRRYLIQLVLAGVGGINPDEAADVLEFCTDEKADLRLGTLIDEINATPSTSRVSDHPPGDTEPGGGEPWLSNYAPLSDLLIRQLGITPESDPPRSPGPDRLDGEPGHSRQLPHAGTPELPG
jgi:hypothetical protein